MKALVRALVALMLVSLIAGTALPLLETNAWWARYLDFPRLQFALLLIGTLVVFWLIGGLRRGGIVLAALALAALGLQVTKLWPYQPLSGRMDGGSAVCGPDTAISILVSNVLKENEDHAAVVAMVERQDADVVVLLETGPSWDTALAPLDARYPHHLQSLEDAATFYGMHVYAKYPLNDGTVTFPFGADTPMITATLAHPGGDLRLFALHPRPPVQFSHGTTMRDATVLQAALDAADAPEPAILAGDWNATPWERTSQRAMRLGGLLDPRAGRAPMVTYDVTRWWMRWPLDQILWQQGLSLDTFRVLDAVGSDHYPVRADLCIGALTTQAPVPPRDDDLVEARATIAAARAMPDAAIGE